MQARVGNVKYFTREQYNETLFVFEQWGIGQFRDTPLAARLFNVIAAQNQDKNKISLDQFVDQIANIMTNTNDSQTL